MITIKDKQAPDVKLGELGLYLRTISQKFPDIKESQDIAAKISSEFGVKCTADDVTGYHQLHIIHEDYELESRRQEHGIIM